MNLMDFGKELARIGLPLLGAALPLPGGAALGQLLASKITGDPGAKPEDILAQLSQNADALAKAKELEMKHEETILQIQVDAEKSARDAEQRQLETINATIQADARGSGWFQRNHHGIECLLSVITVLCVYFGLPLAHVPVPDVPANAWLMLMAFTGVAAWQHGQTTRQLAQNQGAAIQAVSGN